MARGGVRGGARVRYMLGSELESGMARGGVRGGARVRYTLQCIEQWRSSGGIAVY